MTRGMLYFPATTIRDDDDDERPLHQPRTRRPAHVRRRARCSRR
ncbi:hypothetical protein AB5I41_03340 [Sphingomonas sp. MMS24-JH45]